MSDSTDRTQAELAEALSQYAELLSRHGVDSPEAADFYERHKSMPKFFELAAECRRLEEAARRPTEPAAPHARRWPWALAAAGVLALAVSAGWGWILAGRQAAETDRLTAEVSAASLARERHVRDLSLLLYRAHNEADEPEVGDWLAAMEAPDNLPHDSEGPPDSSPDALAAPEVRRAVNGLAADILEALEEDRETLEKLRRESNNKEAQRGAELALDLLNQSAASGKPL